jgi:hypothetical protein
MGRSLLLEIESDLLLREGFLELLMDEFKSISRKRYLYVPFVLHIYI